MDQWLIRARNTVLHPFATKHGQVALDGDGQNSSFVAVWVKRLATPGIEVGKLFRLVCDDVLAATGRKQEPFVYGLLPGEDFFFKVAIVGAMGGPEHGATLMHPKLGKRCRRL